MGVLMEVIPFEFTAAEHVEVEVGDLLTAVFAVVGDEAVAGLIDTESTGDFLSKSGQARHRFRCDILKAVNVLLGDDKDMDRGFGIEVVEGKKIVVFQYRVVGDFSACYLTENAHFLFLFCDGFEEIIAQKQHR